MGKEQFISVTHFINPQLFWYHKIDVPNEHFHEIIQLEQQLLMLFKNKPASRSFRPEVGDIVAVSFMAWNKYIRARIEDIAHFRCSNDGYIVWAIDYGFPFQTKLDHIRRMPESYADKIDHICCGGLANVVPGEKEFDFMEGKAKMMEQDQWNQRACDLLEKLITDAASVTFVEEMQTVQGNWGDLKIVNHKGNTFFARDYLEGINMAIKVEKNFRILSVTLKTIKIPCWLSNNGNNKFKENILHTTVIDRRINHAKDNSCDDFSKQKVEDWCARNERAGGSASVITMESMDVPLSSAAPSIDDIGFDDSVSIKRQPLFKSAPETCDLGLAEQEGFMRLAGALTKSKRGQYHDGKLLKKPPASAFEVSSPNIEQKHSLESYEGERENSGFNALTDSEISGSVITSRKQKLIEMRKKLALKEATEQNQLSFQAETSASSINNITYNQLQESMVNEPVAGSSSFQAPMRQRYIEIVKKLSAKNIENETQFSIQSGDTTSELQYQQLQESTLNETGGDIDSILKTKVRDISLQDTLSSDSSMQSSRAKQLLEMRRKRISVASSASVITEEKILTPTAPLKEMDNDKDETASNTSSGAASSYKELLKNTRKKVQQKKMEVASNDIKKNQDFQFPDFTKEKSIRNSSIANQRSNDPFDGITMIPAGFDLSKLQNYRDEKNHWHRKKSTRNDIVPHDVNESQELLLNISQNTNSSNSSDIWNGNQGDKSQCSITTNTNNTSQNQNFRHTRSHTDKYKKDISPPCDDGLTRKNLIVNFEKTLLDSTVPDLTEQAITPIVKEHCDELNENRQLENIEVNSSLNTTSDESSQQSFRRVNKRRQLKSPADQGPKMDQILRRAKFEKALGNTEILDLNALNVGGGKSESDSNSTNDTISENDSSFGSKSSNNRALLENRIAATPPEASNLSKANKNSIENSDMLKLEKLAQRLHFELDLTKKTPSSHVIMMPHAQQIREIAGERKLQTKFIDHLVLAHSKVPLYPLEKLTDAFFMPEIYEEMVNMHVTKVYRVQSYSWSHLLRGNSLFVVNPRKSGKTWCYLPPICSLVSYRIQNSAVPQTYGPIAIIVVHSAKHVETVYYHCRRLVVNAKVKVSTVPSYGLRNSNEAKIQLLNTCGILVVTPASLLRLLRDNEQESLIDPERLHHLVVDDLDSILTRSQRDFETALLHLYKMVKKPNKQTIPLQVVVTSCHWNSVMMSMIRWSNQPLLLIGDFLEAAVYGKADISIKLRSHEKKLGSVLRFIEEHPAQLERVVILCNTENELDEVVQALTDSGHACIGYGSSSDADVRVTIDEWKHKKLCSQILVCTDSSLPDLQLQNGQSLIHYSIPSSWTTFTRRFATLAQSYKNYIATEFFNSSSEDTAVVYSLILLDEENNMQLPRLMDFMKKHNQIKNIHPDILAVAKRVLNEREELRIANGALLCPFLLEFGECDESRCDHRHHLTRFDKVSRKDDIPSSGDMRVKILKVLSPTHYTARLLEHKSPITSKWCKIRRSDEAALFVMQLNMHYMNMENWITYWPIKINDLCIYKISDTYQRAKILDVPCVTHLGVVQKVRVTLKLIDLGTVISGCKSDELFVCHEQFNDFPAQAIDIRLMGVVPFDNERTWDSKGTKAVQKWIMTDINKNECVFVDINFALANTVWVKNVIVMERLPTVGQYIYRVNLKRSLVEKNFGCLLAANDKGQSVRDIAEEYGLLTMPEEEEQQLDLVEENEDLNESVNLMKFSSNDDEISSCEAVDINRQKKYTKFTKEEINATNEIKDSDSVEDENWDDSFENSSENLINVPLSSNRTFDEEVKFNDEQHIKHEPDTKASSIYKTSPLKPKEEWCTLPLHSITKVEIGDESENGNWSDIYMQRIDKLHMQQFNELLAIINEHIKNMQKLAEKKPAFDTRWLQPRQNCIVKYNNIYCRAKIYGIFGNEVDNQVYRFFLCDYACFVTVKAEELFFDFLYETTCEIVEFVPYQAVHCRLTGINLNQFAKRHPVVHEYLFAYAVQKRSVPPVEIAEFKIHSYDILFFECDSESDFSRATMFNKTLLQHQVATLDVETKHFLELMPSIDFTSFDVTDAEKLKKDFENDKNNDGGVASFEDFLQIICNVNEMDAEEALEEDIDEENKRKIKKTVMETKAICRAAIEQQNKQNDMEKEKLPKIIAAEKCKEKLEKAEHTKQTSGKSFLIESDEELLISTSLSDSAQSINCSQDNNSSNFSTTSPPPLLKSLHKRPPTEWYETDCLIFLIIHAPDIRDYYLEITKDTLIFAAIINNEEQALVLNFLGTVEPQYVSHEIRGLNVVVRLVKTVFMKWPRLLHQATKFTWLNYNYNAINMQEVEHIQPQQRMHLALQGRETLSNANNYDSADDDDGEEEVYQTFTPIVNSEDFHDPTADIY